MEKGTPSRDDGSGGDSNDTTAGDGKNAESREEKRFRSVLPHEPLPIVSGDGARGYVHLQGAFEPKRKATGATKTAEAPPSLYWRSARALEEALLIAFRDDHVRLGLPVPASSVSVIDPNNLSRLRLEYPGPYEALLTQHAFRNRRISPNDILAGHSSATDTDRPVFGGRACQATTITTNPLPADAATYWPRSNPPQFRRLLHDRGDDARERMRTRFVYAAGLVEAAAAAAETVPDWWNQPCAVLQALREVFGADVEVFLPKRQKGKQQLIHSCHVGFRSARDAQTCLRDLQGKVFEWDCPVGTDVGVEKNGAKKVRSGPLFLDYATITQKSRAKQSGDYEKQPGEASRPECTSATAHVRVPGLAVIEDFLTEDEERILVAVLTGPQAPWAPQQSNKSRTGSVKRLVQHYGYVFDYRTADVLRRSEGGGRTPHAADCPPLSAAPERNIDGTAAATVDDLVREGRGWEVLAKVIERTRGHDFGGDLSSSSGGGSSSNDDSKSHNKTSISAGEADTSEMRNDKGDSLPVQAQPQGTKAQKIFADLNQMTVNHYKPGEGIGSHVDTPSAFGDGLISISLNSGIVMEFTKVAPTDREIDPATATAPTKKLVYLPRRSLVLMSGPARFEWEHQIVTRRTDTHNGVVLPRGLRVSLTLRTALSTTGDPLARYESDRFPPVWGEKVGCDDDAARRGTTTNALATPRTERDHVHAVYDAIATQWHHTRGKRGVLWPSATQFVQALPAGSLVADVGCGDGKYFPAVWEAGSYVIGTDISLPLLETSFESTPVAPEGVPDSRRVSPHRRGLQKRPAVAVADCMSVPLRDDSCDAAICIAVMHHLSTPDRRRRCIAELARIVRPRGRIHVQAWAMEQASDSRRRFAATDVFVPFNAQPKYLDRVVAPGSSDETKSNPKAPAPTPEDGSTPTTVAEQSSSKSVAELYSEAYDKADFDERKGLVVFQRYCHMYREGELDDLVRQVPGLKIIENGYESGNHYVILEVVPELAVPAE